LDFLFIEEKWNFFNIILRNSSEISDWKTRDFKVYTRMLWNLSEVGMFECSTIDNTNNLKIK